MRLKFAGLLLLSLAFQAAGSEEHGDEPYEWGGMFEGSDEDYIWVAQKVDGAFAEATMKMVVMTAASTSDEDFEAAEETADTLFELSSCTAVAAGDTITPSSTACFELTFDTGDYENKFYIPSVGADAGLAIFTEHAPSEFESNSHYLRDEEGHDVEAVHSTDEEEHDDEEEGGASTGTVLLGTFVVTLLTFSGVLIVAISATGLSMMSRGVLNGFASGCLIANAAYLMIVESIHLVSDHEWSSEGSEVDYTWRWGTMVLAGFLTPTVSHLLFNLAGMDVVKMIRGSDVEINKTGVELGEVKNTPKKSGEIIGTSLDVAVSPMHDDNIFADGEGSGHSGQAVLVALCLGDFMHNFTDGVIIGAAFKLCSSSVAWGIVVGTCAHELAQEIADYVMLTSAPVNLSTIRALSINFLVGLSCVLGGLMVNQMDIDNGPLGLLLAYGSGTYLYLGASVSLPAALSTGSTNKHTALVVLAFIIGAVAIGLILLDHEHCEAGHEGHGEEEGEDAHADHR